MIPTVTEMIVTVMTITEMIVTVMTITEMIVAEMNASDEDDSDMIEKTATEMILTYRTDSISRLYSNISLTQIKAQF